MYFIFKRGGRNIHFIGSQPGRIQAVCKGTKNIRFCLGPKGGCCTQVWLYYVCKTTKIMLFNLGSFQNLIQSNQLVVGILSSQPWLGDIWGNPKMKMLISFWFYIFRINPKVQEEIKKRCFCFKYLLSWSMFSNILSEKNN